MTEAEAFPYDLCLALQIKHPEHLDRHLTGRQLLDWQRYAKQYGLPNRRNDVHWGMSMAMQYNANRAEDCPAEPPSSFMPYYDVLDDDISKEALEQNIRSLIPRALNTSIQREV